MHLFTTEFERILKKCNSCSGLSDPPTGYTELALKNKLSWMCKENTTETFQMWT